MESCWSESLPTRGIISIPHFSHSNNDIVKSSYVFNLLNLVENHLTRTFKDILAACYFFPNYFKLSL